MRLEVKNFAKIKQADIIIDGITIIAGENNTGKSTVGKILFSLFNSLSNTENKILNQRRLEVERICRKRLREYVVENNRIKHAYIQNCSLAARLIKDNIFSRLEEYETIGFDLIRDILYQELNPLFVSEGQFGDELELINSLAKNIAEILNLSEEVLLKETLSRYFGSIFHKQINSLFTQESAAEVALSVKDKKIELTFLDNLCTDLKRDTLLFHQAIYVDNPFIVDKLSGYPDLNTMDDFLKDLLTKSDGDGLLDGIIGSVLAKEKLAEIYQALETVVNGEISTSDDEFFLEGEGLKKPILFSNLSTGLKSFVLMKMLVEKGALKEKDVLILDEPEIHLHPQWQVAYAELIVLLQKDFDLSVIVTTHSPYFLDAINLFSVKHRTSEKVNYYLSSLTDNEVSMELVTNKIDLIYKKMASPIQMLDTLRYELNNS